MAISIEQVGDWVLADDGWSCRFGWPDARGQFEQQPIVTPRAGASPAIGQGSLSARTMPVHFIYTGSGVLAQAIQTLAGKLGVDDTTVRRVVGTEFDGARVQIKAAISLTSGWDETNSANIVLGSLVSGQTRWEATTNDTVSGVLSDVGQYPALAIPNAGYATVEPTITLQPTVTAHSVTSAAVGWQYRKQVSFTNPGMNSWVNRPLRLDLGATDALVTAGKALASGNDVRILLNGEELPRTLIAWNWAQTYAWIEPPALAPGETVVFDIIYGNPSAGAPAVLTGKLHPSIIYEYAKGAATSGTTTVLNDTVQAWTLTDVNWTGGFLMMLSGAAGNIGQVREIASYTANSVTVATAFPSAIAAGNKYLIFHSSNTRFWFNVGKWFDLYPGATPVRGLWYLDKRDRQPSDIDFNTPASWRPYAMADNADRFAQRSVSVKAGKYYAFLDASRSWQGGGPSGQITSEDGIADGVMFQSSIPILGIQIDHVLSNNLNGMCQAVARAKASGAEDFETVRVFAPAGTNTDTAYVTLPTPDQYFFLYRGLLPSDPEGVIRPDRARDSGSTTADGATRTILTKAAGGPFGLRKDPDSASALVQDSTPANVTVPNATSVELDGRQFGDWRGVLYTTPGGDQYKGWLSKTNHLNTGATAGGDTLVDGGKNWVANELTGAQLKVTGSPNANLVGNVHTVAGNSVTVITVTAPFGATVPQGTTYETIQPKTTVTLQDNQFCWVDFDPAYVGLGALGAEQAVYQIAAEFAVGDGGPALFERKVSTRIGLDGRKVLLRPTEKLILDGPNRKASLVDSTGALIRTLTDPSVLVQQMTRDPVNRRVVTKRAARWSPLGMGTNLITNGDAEGATVGFYTGIGGGGWTMTNPAIDAVTPLSGTRSYFVTVSASGAAGSRNEIYALTTGPGFTVSPGQRVQFSAGLRTSNAGLRPTLGVAWLNNLGNLVSTSYGPAWTPVVNAWHRAGYSAISPDLSNAAIDWTDPQVQSASGSGAIVYGIPIIKITAVAGGETGVVRWDEVVYGAPLLWYAEAGGAGLSVGVSFARGYLG